MHHQRPAIAPTLPCTGLAPAAATRVRYAWRFHEPAHSNYGLGSALHWQAEHLRKANPPSVEYNAQRNGEHLRATLVWRRNRTSGGKNRPDCYIIGIIDPARRWLLRWLKCGHGDAPTRNVFYNSPLCKVGFGGQLLLNDAIQVGVQAHKTGMKLRLVKDFTVDLMQIPPQNILQRYVSFTSDE
jgi:hypothetical protein